LLEHRVRLPPSDAHVATVEDRQRERIAATAYNLARLPKLLEASA